MAVAVVRLGCLRPWLPSAEPFLPPASVGAVGTFAADVDETD